MLEQLAIELMRHENAKAEIFNNPERFTDYIIFEKSYDENKVPCSQIQIESTEGTIKEYTYYL